MIGKTKTQLAVFKIILVAYLCFNNSSYTKPAQQPECVNNEKKVARILDFFSKNDTEVNLRKPPRKIIFCAESFFFPFKNEYDPNAGVVFKERVVARYMLDLFGEYRFYEIDNILNGLALTFDARFLFGDSRPQLDYNLRANPIVAYLTPGITYYFQPWIGARLTHRETIDLGGYVDDVDRKNWSALGLRIGYTDQELQRYGRLRWAAYIEPSLFLDGNGYDAEPGVGVFDRTDKRRVWARYKLELFARASVGSGWLGGFFVYANPTLYFGRTGLPNEYQFDAEPLNMLMIYGVGYRFNDHVEIRTMSSQIWDLGGMIEERERLVWNGISLRLMW